MWARPKSRCLMRRRRNCPDRKQHQTGAGFSALLRGLLAVLGCLASAGWLCAQPVPQFALPLRSSNQEIVLRFNAPTGVNCRIDGSTNLPRWDAMLTLLSTGMNQYLDSAAPYLSQRFYRAEQLSETNLLTGDHFATTNGEVIVHPIGHASFV